MRWAHVCIPLWLCVCGKLALSYTTQTQCRGVQRAPCLGLWRTSALSPISSASQSSEHASVQQISELASQVYSLVDDIQRLATRIEHLEKIKDVAPLPRVPVIVKGSDLVPLNAVTIQRGSYVSCVILGYICGLSILSNLRVLGALAGYVVVYLWGNDKSRVGEIIRSLGINVVLAYRALREKYEQVLFMYRTGRLSYIAYRQWDSLDNRYQLTKRFDAFQAKIKEARKGAVKLDKEYDFSGQLIRACQNGVDRIRDQFSADRAPGPFNNFVKRLFRTKKQRRDELLRKYRVRFCGQRRWRPFDE